ncbi:MAG TPA: HlyD family secretion protein, partial [Rhodomicrobium sp.]|nr:HlyD family secretion protein [Rhodomicrobium sp.]
MTTHPRSFDIQNALPASGVMDRLNLAPEAPALQKTSKPRWLRKLLLTGASLIALAGAAHFGYGYWSVGRFEISTD